jgi:8-amino-3,8-dideoxy-alpha-D-manno-octulosonate transaminase
MTELQAAIGIVQLSKLQLIISQQRKNKNQMMTLLRDQPLEFRRSVDPSGDLGDTIVMILPDAVTAQKFAKSLRDQRVGLKNLPDAMRWHFARYWNHLLRDVANGANDLENSWSVSAEILERCVALPINVNMTSEDTDRMASSVAQACRVTL